CTRVVGADQLVRFGREEAEEINGDFPFLQFPDRPPLRRPYASEECKRPRLVQGEPDWRPCAIRKRLILGETRERNNAAILNSEPPPPVRGVDVANVRHAWVRLPTDKIFGRRWHPPPSQCQLAAFRLIPDNRGRVIRKYRRHGRHVASAIVHHTRPVADRLLIGCYSVEIAQGSALLIATCCASARQCRGEPSAGHRGPMPRPRQPARPHIQTRAIGQSG